MSPVETEFARKVIEVTRGYQGKLPSGSRAIWLFTGVMISSIACESYWRSSDGPQ